MQIGFVGLGNMGRNLVLNLQDNNHQIIGWNRSEEKREIARDEGITVMDSLAEMVDSISEQRKVVWMMVSAGEAIDSVLFDEGNLADLLGEGDIIVDGANSHYTDTVRRSEKLSQKGITLLDCGVSGGIKSARNNPSLMIGGDVKAFEFLEKLFSDLAATDGYGYFGKSGAGHYVKMVHNGIEYGMMQSIAEGLNLLSSSEYAADVDLAKAVDVWNHGSVIQSNLIGFLSDAMQSDSKLEKVGSEIGSLGTGKWTTEEAIRLGVPLGAIKYAVDTRKDSREKEGIFLYRVIQAMREQFGGHNSKERPSR